MPDPIKDLIRQEIADLCELAGTVEKAANRSVQCDMPLAEAYRRGVADTYITTANRLDLLLRSYEHSEK